MPYLVIAYPTLSQQDRQWIQQVREQHDTELVKLHDALYRRALASELRLDIPFLPHITIGKTSDPWQAKALADQLNQQSLAIQGRLETLDVIMYEKMTVQTLERIPLVSESD